MQKHNTFTILSQIGREPESKYLPDGTQILEFSVPFSKGKKQPDGSWADTPTTWFRVSCFGRLAETLESRLTKGTAVYVAGELNAREYQGKDGTAKTSLEVRAEHVVVVGGGKVAGESATAAEESSSDFMDNIPF